jgi:hypothetical protein
MTEPTFMTDEGFHTLRAIHRLRKVLQREGKVYFTELHKRCGVGLSTEQFTTIVNDLAASQWCYVKEGRLGARLVVFNEAFRAVNVPEMQEREQWEKNGVFSSLNAPVPEQ